MSTTISRIAFLYGFSVSRSVKALDFKEGGAEIQASLRVGNYTVDTFVVEVQRALNEVGGQTYTVAYNVTTRIITVSAPGTFSLLFGTGSRTGTSCSALMGFAVADRTAALTYSGTIAVGTVYITPWPVFRFTDKTHSIVLEDSTVDTTPLGISQVASFATGSRITMEIKPITNKNLSKNGVSNAYTIADFMAFMSFLMTKGRATMYMDPANFAGTSYKVFLEGTEQDREAKAFKLQNVAMDIYTSGLLTFREVLV